MLLPIFFSLSGDHRDLHSFPTRRSSDLGDLAEAFADQRHVWLRRARENAVLFACGLAGTFINPYGVGLHREVLSAVTSSSLANNIEEYLPPNFNELASLPFLIVVLATMVLLALTARRMPFRWLAVVI